MKPDNKAFLKQTRKLLDSSADSLDAQTLSKLNQARQKALQSQHAKASFGQLLSPAKWSAAVAASVSVAVVGSWLVMSSPQPQMQLVLQPDSLSDNSNDLNILVSNTELELLEQLAFVSWLVEQEMQQPNVDRNTDQNNAG